MSWSYEDPIAVTGDLDSRGAAQRFATAAVILSYLMRDDWASSLSYQDQSLLGAPTNTTLGKTVQLSLQHRWTR